MSERLREHLDGLCEELARGQATGVAVIWLALIVATFGMLVVLS